MHEWMSMSHVRRGCNFSFGTTLRPRRNVLSWMLDDRIWLCSPHRPQRGFHEVLGPLGRAFLRPRPMGVVDDCDPEIPTHAEENAKIVFFCLASLC